MKGKWMRRVLALLLCVELVLGSASAYVSAEEAAVRSEKPPVGEAAPSEESPVQTAGEEDDSALADWTYTRNEEEATVTLEAYLGTAETVCLPAKVTIDGSIYRTVITPDTVYVGENGLVEVLSFEEGFELPENWDGLFAGKNRIRGIDFRGVVPEKPASVSHLFEGCSGLRQLNMSTVDLSGVSSVEGILDGCINLTDVWVPLNLSRSVALPWLFEDGAGTTYETLPAGVTESFEIHSTGIAVFDLSEWEYTRSAEDLTVTLLEYKAYDDKCRIPVAVTLDGVRYAVNILPETDYGFMCELSFEPGFRMDSCRRLFYDKSTLWKLDLSGVDTSRATDMNAMFYNCECLRSLNLSSFDTSHVTDMAEMFSNCCRLTSLDVSGFERVR